MSWMSRLYRTYESALQLEESKPWPISHFLKASHVEVVIDSQGNFKKGRVRLLSGEEASTLIPATEESAGRAGAKIAPHPLCEELSYIAGDLPKIKPEKFQAYITQLEEWEGSEYSHPKVKAVFNYIKKQSLWRDLEAEVDFPIKFKSKSGQLSSVSPEKAFVRWRVEEEGNPDSNTWDDLDLINAWIAFERERYQGDEFCFITGELGRTAKNHPKFLRNASDGAKLVSSNDDSGFTFRGRFLAPSQAANVDFEVTQKAHNALRWLIERQGKRNGDQVIVTWAISCVDIPSPLDEPFEYDLDDLSVVVPVESDSNEPAKDFTRNLGFTFAQKLNQTMAGYKAKLDKPDDTVVIMAIDSATPGRMGVVYYREHAPLDYIDVLTRWHREFSWPQRHKVELPQTKGKAKEKTMWLPFAPTPWSILNTAYGDIIKSNETLKKNLFERLLPCIVDGQNIPLDILQTCIRRASSFHSKEYWEWERNLGVTCALFKGYYCRHPKPAERREYSMALDRTSTSRDYLYGRLLAMAERIEGIALSVANVNRPTSANRLMHRFSDRPFSTWRTINQQLQPYMQQLQTSRAGFLTNSRKEIDEIMGLFVGDEFTDDTALSGEYLLGFHCQRLALRENKSPEQQTEIQTQEG